MRMRRHMLGLVVLGLVACTGAGAQAPAGAPAGANGICKDGTYSMAASKDGACRGHKGVQTWYAASASKPAPAPAMPAPSPAASVPSQPAPKPVQTVPAAPAPSAPPAAASSAAATSASSKKLSPAQAAAQKQAAPGGGPGLVWVNTSSNVYHCNGDPFYGKTKAGKYMSEDAAKAAGAHGDRGKTCAGK